MTPPFRANLARTGVAEHCALRGRVGLMAFHGGALERVTDVVAREVADRIGGSYYLVLHPDDEVHVPSAEVDPAHSPTLFEFVAHVDVAVSLHGYGRRDAMRTVLLGGRNRDLAGHLDAHLSAALPGYEIVSDLVRIPKDLAGQHRANPVNRPRRKGVQIELPPALRWNREHHGWSDADGIPRAPQVDALIAALSDALV